MKQQRSSSNLIVIAIILGPACDGLDPDAFAPSAPARQTGGQAGYHYGAGSGGNGGGGGGRGSGGTAATNPPAANSAGSSNIGEGGTGTASEPLSDGGGALVGEGGGGVGATTGRGGGPTDGSGGDSGASGGAANARGGSVGVSGSAGAMDSTGGGGAAGGFAGNGSAGSDPGGGGGGSNASGGSAGGGPVTRSLSLGEYVEGSASYKAIELVALDASTLDGCRLVTYSNGSSTGSGIALTGSVPALGTHTLCSSSLAALLADTCDRTTSLSFNGNDAVALECDGALVDVLGQIGFDPGSAWIGVNGSTQDTSLRRRCDSESDADGTDAFDPDADWLAFPTDTFAGLGDPACG